MSETFEDWWELFELECIQSDDNFKVIEIVESAWNHQQKKIDELEKKLAEAVDSLRFLREKISELIIDDCGYNPESENREQLLGAVYGSSERCEEILSFIDCTLGGAR